MIAKTVIDQGEIESTFEFFESEETIRLPRGIDEQVWIQCAYLETESEAGDQTAAISFQVEGRGSYRRSMYYVRGKRVSKKKYSRARKGKSVKKRWVKKPMSASQKSAIRRAAIDQLRAMLNANGLDTGDLGEVKFLVLIGSDPDDLDRMQRMVDKFLGSETDDEEEGEDE